MENFRITFENPKLLLLLIPAVILTLLPYFLMPKKYRKTRNRITSIVLHMVVMVLAILVLAQVRFQYEKPDEKCEMILLVDLSYSNEKALQDKNKFVESVIDGCSRENIKLGVVTFGADTVEAVAITDKFDRIYQTYLNAELPDDSATNVAKALEFAAEKFKTPQTAKIVLLTDGIETDNKAALVIKEIVSQGVRLDVVQFPNQRGEEVQLIDSTLPEYNVAVGDTFKLSVKAQSSFYGPVRIVLYDNGTPVATKDAVLESEFTDVEFEHKYDLPGMHELAFAVESERDTVSKNNRYTTYMYLEIFDKILLIEREGGESDELRKILENSDYNVTVLRAQDEASFPKSLNDLREYDQVILCNIANADLPDGFDRILYSYVRDIGGGLFTVGGTRVEDGQEVPNAYNKKDMIGTLYQDMLPVQAIDYTPPVGVIIIVDRSGSMSTTDSVTGKNKLELAKDGARSLAEFALTERDWCGVMSLETTYSEELQLTPRPNIAAIRAAIDSIEMGGGTNYAPALDYAGRALMALSAVERRHIIIVSDGQPGDKYEDYAAVIDRLYKDCGITVSIVSIGDAGTKTQELQDAAALGNGRFHVITDFSTAPTVIREDINVPEIKQYTPEPFIPQIHDRTAAVNGLVQEEMPELGGFFGTKLKNGADMPLSATYAPAYAQWKFGKGSVGSFMSDLNGTWSASFLASNTGVRFINNVVQGLFPTVNIRTSDLDIQFKYDNYTTTAGIFTKLATNERGEVIERIELLVKGPTPADGSAPKEQRLVPSGDSLTRIPFETREPGVYTVTAYKYDANGQIISEWTEYCAFSYSKEYDCFVDQNVATETLAALAQDGKGHVVSSSNPAALFENFVQALHFIRDPRIVLVILAIALFLADVAVRKFKFKWLHEIIRDRKNKAK